jgi:peptide/nickel transport system substrate-binding protein
MSRWQRGACVVALVLCAGCVGERAVAPAAGEPAYGGTVVVASPDDLGPLNSLVNGLRYGQEVLRYALALPLVAWGPDLGLEPALARSWELSGDTAVVFELRDDVRWHDGERTTAYDVEFTFGRAMGAASTYPNAGDFAAWTGIEVLDSFRIRFRFTPHADPLAGVPFLPIMPRHLLDSIPAERMQQAAFNRQPVGNGPFRFVEYRPNERYVLEANPDFPEELGGRPYIDRFVWRIIQDDAGQVAELRTGNAHLAMNVKAQTWTGLAADPALRAFTREARQYSMIAWNGRRAPFDDARVRRALIMAVDRQRIIDVLRRGHGYVAPGPVGRYHWSYDRTLAPVPYDSMTARALLLDAGIRDRDGDGVLEKADGSDFTIELLFPPINDDLAQLIQNDLGAIGVRVNPRTTEFATIVGRVMSPERAFDAALLAWEADFRLSLRAVFHGGERDAPFQIAGYANPVADSLIDRTERLTDRDAARPLLHELQRILRDDQPWGFLYYYDDLYAARAELGGTDMDIRGALVNLPRWWIAGAAASAAR